VSPILGIWASQNYSRLPVYTSDYESIQTVNVGGTAQSSITFTSIPSTFKHLQVRLISRENGTNPGQAPLWLRFNSDSGNNYSWHRFYGIGSGTPGADSGTTTDWILAGIGAENSNPANNFSATIFDVLDYANTSKNKTIRGLSGEDVNGAGGYIGFHSGLWRNTNAITSMTIYPNATQSFIQYSQFALYGIKG
jgi:hypothetical protein